MWPPATTSIPTTRDGFVNGLPPFTIPWGDWPQDHPLATGQGAGQALGHSDEPAPHDADEEDEEFPQRKIRRRTQSRPQYRLAAYDDSGFQMMPNIHVEEHRDDEWALPSSNVSVDDEKDLSIHVTESSADATESSADGDDLLKMEQKTVDAMETGKRVARRPDGVNIDSPKEPASASVGDENAAVNSGLFFFFAPL